MIVNSLAAFSNVLPDRCRTRPSPFTAQRCKARRSVNPAGNVALRFTEGTVGDEVGKAYAAKYFPPETKAAMDVLVKNVLGAMGRRIDGLAGCSLKPK